MSCSPLSSASDDVLARVAKDDSTCFEGRRLQELEPQLVRTGFEKRIALSQNDRGHAEPVFVEQAAPGERRGKVGATEDEQVLARLLLQSGDLLLGTVFHQP